MLGQANRKFIALREKELSPQFIEAVFLEWPFLLTIVSAFVLSLIAFSFHESYYNPSKAFHYLRINGVYVYALKTPCTQIGSEEVRVEFIELNHQMLSSSILHSLNLKHPDILAFSLTTLFVFFPQRKRQHNQPCNHAFPAAIFPAAQSVRFSKNLDNFKVVDL